MFTGRQEVMDSIQVTVMFHEFEFFVLTVALAFRRASG
jgi:hypothetical protein